MGSSRLACGVEGVAIPLTSSSSPAVDLRNQRVNGMVGSKMVLIDGLPLAGVGEKHDRGIRRCSCARLSPHKIPTISPCYASTNQEQGG